MIQDDEIMIKLLGISGSLRKGSFNTALLHGMAESISGNSSQDIEIEFEVKTLHGIPLYDGDLESEQGIPEAVVELGAAILRADGVILCTPEYNHSIPGVFKNAIDWLSRLDEDVFSGKAVALAGATLGGFGTILSQKAWLPVLHALDAQVWAQGKLMVSKANGWFDENGKVKEDANREKLKAFIDGFAEFAAGC